MKNFLKISLLAAVLLTSVATYANDDRGFSLTQTEVNGKSVVFDIEQTQKIEVTIAAKDGEVLYQKDIQVKKGSKRVYDLASFPDGDYTFSLVTDKEIAEYQVSMFNGKTVISEPKFTELFKPTLTKENEIITLKFENVLKEPVEILILDENSEQLYSNTFDAKSAINNKFNVYKSDARELTFILKSKSQEFVKVVSLR